MPLHIVLIIGVPMRFPSILHYLLLYLFVFFSLVCVILINFFAPEPWYPEREVGAFFFISPFQGRDVS